jgi:uncharacterized RDD family membrane protein YckC
VNRATARLGARRLGAWCIDWLILSAFAGALVPIGLVLNGSVRLPPIGWNALSFVALVVPATLWLAAWEAGARAATPGKRVLRLRVDPAGWPRSSVRNGLKVALPWELGHTAAYTLASPASSPAAQAVGMVCGVAACAIALVYVVSLFVGAGRTPYDRVAGTAVSG